MSLGDPDILYHTLLPVITSPSTGSSVSGTANISVAVTVPAGATVASVYLQKLGGGQIGTAAAPAPPSAEPSTPPSSPTAGTAWWPSLWTARATPM
jgi:hypothetical protein